jgi:hypothetical protein
MIKKAGHSRCGRAKIGTVTQDWPPVKNSRANRWWKFAVVLTIGGVLTLVPWSRGIADESAFAETRLALREQGFKTDLTDFDFSTSPELQARTTAVNATASPRNVPPFLDHPNLMENAGNNAAIVIWKQASLKRRTPSWPDGNSELTWDDFRQVVDTNRPQVNVACAAILSGPLQFNLRASDGNYMLLPHLAVLKNLTQVLADRMLLDLHDGNRDAAFTNLLAATRLATAWKVEPAQVSRRVRFEIAQLAFAATWQALQAEDWTDEQRARLQREWEAAEFLADLPEIAAFKCASDVKEAEYEPPVRPRLRPSFDSFAQTAMDDPASLWFKLLNASRQRDYLEQGSGDDKRDMLLFYRDREIELRNAIKAPSWEQMRDLPGVTNAPVFHSKYPTQAEMRRNTWEISRRFQERGKSLLAAAAETEMERRLIVTSLALERFRDKHGSYPNALAGLVPEFLKAIPLDFMDGQPLRYRRTEESRFALYSVGLDCVDNGGKFQPTKDNDHFDPFHPAREAPADLVWPLAATVGDVTAKRKQEQKAHADRMAQLAEQEKTGAAEAEAARQATLKKLLTQGAGAIKDPMYRGKPLSDFLQSQPGAATKKLTMAQLLSARQVVTGAEPDLATFEVPIRYDIVTNFGLLRLLVDGAEGNLQDCERGTNGNCLLVWNTTYNAPGQHALQAQLECTDWRGGWHDLEVKGPVLPFYSSNVLQFVEGTSLFTDKGASLYAKLADQHGVYTIELQSPTGEHLKTISGTTTNGVIDVFWDLRDDHGNKYTNDSLKAVYNVTLPDSGRSQSTKGP